MDIDKILEENETRERRFDAPYDPLLGIGCCGDRVAVDDPDGRTARVPCAMLADPDFRPGLSRDAWRRLRCRHDFEYWCAACATVRHKITGGDVSFVLNTPQRRVAALMEADRTAGRPIRIIMLKARQWGGSTLVQMYMAWIQSCVRRNWNSIICAHVKDTAAGIRGMYTKLLANYPTELWEGDCPPEFRPFERSLNVREISGRGCRVTIGSSENQDAVRGADYSMAHLSETAFWPVSPRHSPQDFIRAVCGSVALKPDSLIVLESTANGVGNYFHTEWLRSKEGASDKHAVFVPWYEIEIYRLAPPQPREFAASFSPYERGLWDLGLSLSQIWWYRCKASEYPSHDKMQAEFPTTDTEAFLNTGSGVFGLDHVENLRSEGCTLQGCRGDFDSTGAGFTPDERGCAVMWTDRSAGADYVVAVDIGGRSEKSDWSVIAVVKRAIKPEVVAQWRGHIDHDLLADKAMAVARYYNNALLVIESNTLESETAPGSGDTNLYILNRMAAAYPRMYRRRTFDRTANVWTRHVGFHTNRATKAMLISNLIEMVREGRYVERDNLACNELATYEQTPTGAYAARPGCHDDILMTRAIALLAISETALPAVGDGNLPKSHFW